MAAPRNQPPRESISGVSRDGSADLPSRQATRRVSHLSKPDTSNEEFRAQIHKLQYELDSLKQERDAVALRHQEELRQVQTKAEADFKRAQVSESSSHVASGKYEAMAQELEELKEQSATDKRNLEKKLRVEQDRNQSLEEELQDVQAQQSSQQRQLQHEITDLQAKIKTAQQTTEELRSGLEEKSTSLHNTQQKLSQRETEIADLDNEILRLKTQNSDLETFDVIKRELSQQVDHIAELEGTNLNQSIELKKLRGNQKSIDIVEEEKRSLEAKMKIMHDLRKELSEAQLQRQILEDERKSWSAYLQGMTSDDNEHLQINTPEELAKAFVKERYERLALVDELGKAKPELAVKDDTIRSLQDKVAKLKAQQPAAQTAIIDASDNKSLKRLERQRVLAVKEVEYLRAQLKAFDSEETQFQAETYDEHKTKRIQELEDLVDQHRKELQSLHTELEQSQTHSSTNPQPINPLKRASEPDVLAEERIGELTRKTRTLQDSLTQTTTSNNILQTELDALKSQLAAQKARSQTRVLELRSNPTTLHATAQQTTLDALRAENTALLARLETPTTNPTSNKRPSSSKPSDTGVPHATLDRMRSDLLAKDAELAQKDKHILRLKQVFASKSREFREAVASILGWKFDFLPNGRVRVTSLFNPGEKEDEGGEGEKSIVFDGDNETMKVSGGPQSAFAGEIRGLVEFWVDGRNEIPCFLAAATLEFWERSTRGGKV